MGVVNASAIIAGDMPSESLGARALDDYRFEIKLERNAPYFPTMLAMPITFPVYQPAIENFGDEWTKKESIVSNGAFILDYLKHNQRITVVRNERYWNNELNFIEKVNLRLNKEPDKHVIDYQAGELDMAAVPDGRLDEMRSRFPGQIVTQASLCNIHLMFNVDPERGSWATEKPIRQALNYAFEREPVIQGALGNQNIGTVYLVPEGIAGYQSPTLDMVNLSQSERDRIARELMNEAGYNEENKLSIEIFLPADTSNKYTQLLAQMWQSKLPVNVAFTMEEWQLFMQRKGASDFDISWGGWCGDYNEASTFLNLFRTGSFYNEGKFSDVEYDRMMTASQTSDNPNQLYQQAEKILLDSHVLIPYLNPGRARLIAPDIRGWPVGNAQGFYYSRTFYRLADAQ